MNFDKLKVYPLNTYQFGYKFNETDTMLEVKQVKEYLKKITLEHYEEKLNSLRIDVALFDAEQYDNELLFSVMSKDENSNYVTVNTSSLKLV